MEIFIGSRERKGRGKGNCTDIIVAKERISFEKVYWGEIFFYLKEKRPRVWKEKRK